MLDFSDKWQCLYKLYQNNIAERHNILNSAIRQKIGYLIMTKKKVDGCMVPKYFSRRIVKLTISIEPFNIKALLNFNLYISIIA